MTKKNAVPFWARLDGLWHWARVARPAGASFVIRDDSLSLNAITAFEAEAIDARARPTIESAGRGIWQRTDLLIDARVSSAASYGLRSSTRTTVQGYPPDASIVSIGNLAMRPFPSGYG